MARERITLVLSQAKVILQSQDLRDYQKIEQIKELDNILTYPNVIFEVCKLDL